MLIYNRRIGAGVLGLGRNLSQQSSALTWPDSTQVKKEKSSIFIAVYVYHYRFVLNHTL